MIQLLDVCKDVLKTHKRKTKAKFAFLIKNYLSPNKWVVTKIIQGLNPNSY